MRGYYEVISRQDPRWNKEGRDFICQHRGPLNFCIKEYINKMKEKLGCRPPADMSFMVYWEGENVNG